VIATATGGVAEVVRDGENGLLVPVGDSAALAAAIRRYFADGELHAQLRDAAAESVAGYAPERVFARLEETLAAVARTLRR
jgi:glycosyltransferase involved in cell wall biosynthesis